MTNYAACRAEALCKEQRAGRRFHIIVGASCGLFVLFLMAVVWLSVATEPRRRAAYLADCQTEGFSAPLFGTAAA